MKFGFIAGKNQKSFACLSERAQQRGHELVHIPLRDIPISIEGVTDFVKECADNFDALHYYAGIADPIGIVFGEICEEQNIPLLNNRARIPHLLHDKMFQTLRFSQGGLPVPKSMFTRNPCWSTLTKELGKPVVAKRVRGTHGNHVHKVSSPEDLAVVDQPARFVFQEYLPHKNDVRVLVLTGRAICGYRRVPAPDDFRTNLARGGYAEPIADDTERKKVYELAEAAVQLFNQDLAGVDIIKSEIDDTYRVIEINTNPSWYGITDSTNMHFEDALLDVYETLAQARHTEK
jgi:RimK family alpha-L-glutamate ligase